MLEKVLGTADYAAVRVNNDVFLIAKGEGRCFGVGFEQRPERIIPPLFNFNFFIGDGSAAKRFTLIEKTAGVDGNPKSLTVFDSKGDHNVSIKDRREDIEKFLAGDGGVFPH